MNFESAYVLTMLGEWYVIVPLFLVLGYFWVRYGGERGRAQARALLVSITSTQIFVHLVKYLVARPRPALGLIDESGFSFPSGHAAIAVAFWGLACLFLYQKIRKPFYKFIFIVLSVMIVAGIGLSRLYFVVHYPSDVIAGYLFGLACASASYFYYLKFYF